MSLKVDSLVTSQSFAVTYGEAGEGVAAETHGPQPQAPAPPPAVTAAQSATREREGAGTAEGGGCCSTPVSAVRETQRAVLGLVSCYLRERLRAGAHAAVPCLSRLALSSEQPARPGGATHAPPRRRRTSKEGCLIQKIQPPPPANKPARA